MQFNTLLLPLMLTTVFSLSLQTLERRKSFVQTHQEHGHLPGGKNNPGATALISQVMEMLGGKSPSQVLNEYNERADQANGKEYGSGKDGASKGGVMSSLGLEDIPLVGGLI